MSLRSIPFPSFQKPNQRFNYISLMNILQVTEVNYASPKQQNQFTRNIQISPNHIITKLIPETAKKPNTNYNFRLTQLHIKQLKFTKSDLIQLHHHEQNIQKQRNAEEPN